MKNFKKKLASLLALVSMVSCMSAIPTYALSTGALPVSNKIVDNDPLSGAGSMTRSGFDTYIKASGLWNGDARKQTCSSNTTYYYKWGFPQTYSRSRVNLYVSVEVYLNNINFTDKYAKYEIERGTYLYATSLGTINQNTAPSGWYKFDTKTVTPITYSSNVIDSRASSIVLTTSKSSSSYTAGADAIKYSITT